MAPSQAIPEDHLDRAFAVPESETAGPSPAPDFLSKLVASRTPCGFPYRKPHTLLSLAPRTGNPGTLGMTKGEGGVHLNSCYKGLKELYAQREASDPSIHITNCRGRNKSTLCHPERSRGICSSLHERQKAQRSSETDTVTNHPVPSRQTTHRAAADFRQLQWRNRQH